MKLVDLNNVKELLDFSNDAVYIMMLIARKKNNEELTSGTEIVYREVIRDLTQFDHKITKFTALAKIRPEEFKMYISCNPRSTLRAYRALKERFAQWDHDMAMGRDSTNFMKSIGAQHMSCLQKNPEKKKYFMFDLDDKTRKDKVFELMYKYGTGPEIAFETKNGYHILFEPFDTRDLMHSLKYLKIDCELKRDDLLCIGYEE